MALVDVLRHERPTGTRITHVSKILDLGGKQPHRLSIGFQFEQSKDLNEAIAESVPFREAVLKELDHLGLVLGAPLISRLSEKKPWTHNLQVKATDSQLPLLNRLRSEIQGAFPSTRMVRGHVWD